MKNCWSVRPQGLDPKYKLCQTGGPSELRMASELTCHTKRHSIETMRKLIFFINSSSIYNLLVLLKCTAS